jgi:hypothetical protein
MTERSETTAAGDGMMQVDMSKVAPDFSGVSNQTLAENESLRADIAALRSGQLTREVLTDALQSAWNDWCVDTGCFPDFIKMHGPPTTQLSANFESCPNFITSVLGFLARSGVEGTDKDRKKEQGQ